MGAQQEKPAPDCGEGDPLVHLKEGRDEPIGLGQGRGQGAESSGLAE